MGQMRDIGHEIQEQVRSTLGLEFQVQSFDIRKGSVTIFVAVSTAFGFYMGFSRYALDATAYAAFVKESRKKRAGATKLHRNSGEASDQSRDSFTER
jgi:hypothetical protein